MTRSSLLAPGGQTSSNQTLPLVHARRRDPAVAGARVAGFQGRGRDAHDTPSHGSAAPRPAEAHPRPVRRAFGRRILRTDNASLPHLQNKVIYGRVESGQRRRVLHRGHRVQATSMFHEKELRRGIGTRLKEEPLPEIGDKVELYVRYLQNPMGEMEVSGADRVRAARSEGAWREIVQHYKLGTHVKGRVLNAVNGGYAVGIAGLVAFLPNHRVRPFRGSPAPPAGELLPFKILGVTESIKNAILVGPMTGGARRDARDGTAPWARRGSNRGGDGKEKGARSNRGGKADERPANGARDAGAFWKRKKHGARRRRVDVGEALRGGGEVGRRERRGSQRKRRAAREEDDRAAGAGRGGRAADVGGRREGDGEGSRGSRGVMNGIRRLLMRYVDIYYVCACSLIKLQNFIMSHECRSQKSFFFLFGRPSPSCFRSFPPTRRLPPAPGTPRARSSAASFPKRTTATPPRAAWTSARASPPWRTSRGTTRRGPKICTPRWSATGSRRGSSRRTPACFGTSRGSRSSGSRGWTRARPARARRGPSSIGVPPPRRTTASSRIPSDSESSAWTSDAKTSHADPSTRSGAPFDFGEAVGPRRARRRWRGCSPRLPWSRPRAPTTTRWGPTASAASRA